MSEYSEIAAACERLQNVLRQPQMTRHWLESYSGAIQNLQNKIGLSKDRFTDFENGLLAGLLAGLINKRPAFTGDANRIAKKLDIEEELDGVLARQRTLKFTEEFDPAKTTQRKIRKDIL